MMKKCNYYIVIIVSFFFLAITAKADYKASALNPNNASCNLYKGSLTSTGYCYYENKNLNSYTSGVIWLDTGDQVTVLTNYKIIDSPNKELCSDYYVYTSFYYKNKTNYGYYCNANLVRTDNIPEEIKTEFRNLGFPESYWEKLYALKTAHPDWNFVAIKTSLNFSDVVENQTYGSRSLIRRSMSNNYAYLDIKSSSFDYHNDKFIAYDDNNGSDPWYIANYDTVAYYLDPRNFLTDQYIFQFETLSYDSSMSDDKLKTSINSIFGSDYLNKFTDIFVEAGKISLVNPIYLASLSKEEVANGSTAGTAINGTYNGMYNFYNIGANSGSNPVYNGLSFASSNDESTLRPWNTEYKAIVGGAKWIYNNYVYTGQDTSYFKKFNVVYNYLKSTGKTPVYNNYNHQYMQNITAPSSEANTTYTSYYKNDLLNLSYTFYIPVYNNMPEATKLPTKMGWPNNRLKEVLLNETKIAEFDEEVETYNFNLDINNPTLKIEATAISSKAKVEGTGTFEIKENTTKSIKVTAENGDVKTYKINITLVGSKLEDPIDVVTTLNNAGIKNGDKYITGINPGTNISVIFDKVVGVNNQANVIIKNYNSTEKKTGTLSTGDKVEIKVGTEIKNFEIVVYGDINGDSSINALDFIQIRKYMLKELSLSGSKFEAADMNKDGSINALDFIQIRKYMLGDSNAIKQ